jgi:hypothetical protein
VAPGGFSLGALPGQPFGQLDRSRVTEDWLLRAEGAETAQPSKRHRARRQMQTEATETLLKFRMAGTETWKVAVSALTAGAALLAADAAIGGFNASASLR